MFKYTFKRGVKRTLCFEDLQFDNSYTSLPEKRGKFQLMDHEGTTIYSHEIQIPPLPPSFGLSYYDSFRGNIIYEFSIDLKPNVAESKIASTNISDLHFPNMDTLESNSSISVFSIQALDKIKTKTIRVYEYMNNNSQFSSFVLPLFELFKWAHMPLVKRHWNHILIRHLFDIKDDCSELRYLYPPIVYCTNAEDLNSMLGLTLYGWYLVRSKLLSLGFKRFCEIIEWYLRAPNIKAHCRRKLPSTPLDYQTYVNGLNSTLPEFVVPRIGHLF